jgi:hypothetical protein
MASPAGPIYASTLHRRDRSWRHRRRRGRGMVWSGAGVAVMAMLIAHFA